MTEKPLPLTIEQRLEAVEARMQTITAGFSEILAELAKLNNAELAQHTKPWDPDKIAWFTAQGTKGPYEKSTEASNPEFQRLVADLNKHDGKMSFRGYFYWLFSGGKAVGRKKRNKSWK